LPREIARFAIRRCVKTNRAHRVLSMLVMRLSVAWLAVTIVLFHVVAAVVAVIVNLPAQFTTGGEPKEDLGWDVVVAGSAVSAPLAPLAVLIVGAWLASRTGRLRTAGLVLLVLVSVVMIVGWVGEYVSGIPFTGGRYVVFQVLSVLGIALTIALPVAAVRELVRGTA
jgi:hypothetical protein